ncbi:MAG: NAD(P)/FAD-dependent oxidoreductase [Solirubrobacteraceae bacterium]
MRFSQRAGGSRVPWLLAPPSDAQRAAFSDAEPHPYWNDTLKPRDPHLPLETALDCDLCIVGGGFTGLWAALYAKQLDSQRSVVVLEASRCGAGASSRNGGFLNYSLTHGISNGLERFPAEIGQIERLAMRNFDELVADLGAYGIEAEFEPTGELDVAVNSDQAAELAEAAALAARYGQETELMDRDRVRAEVHSPVYEGGLWYRSGAAMVNPAKLADGLRQAALAAGVQIFEHTRVSSLRWSGSQARPLAGRRPFSGDRQGSASVIAVTDGGLVRARRVLLATNAYKPLLGRMRHFVAPVYDYVLVTEPLSAAQMESVGWNSRQGIGDSGNQFHYYRLTADNRILWGGYDAVYRYGGPVRPDLDTDEHTFARLSANFFTTFPQLEGVRFTHRWGGAIDTCSRFSVFFGRAFAGSVAYALGYTGLGVGASRFGGRTGVDLLDARRTQATGLELVRRRPVPFPPEPLRSAVIQATRNRIEAADRSGKRGLWLRTLDRFGVGFDS